MLYIAWACFKMTYIVLRKGLEPSAKVTIQGCPKYRIFLNHSVSSWMFLLGKNGSTSWHLSGSSSMPSGELEVFVEGVEGCWT